MTELTELQTTIDERIAAFDPDVELIALERPAAETLRLYIDHPDGVDLALCERVTGELRDLLESYSLEVSSPGIDRPLTKPEHFRRYLGRRVKVRTSEPIDGPAQLHRDAHRGRRRGGLRRRRRPMPSASRLRESTVRT